MVTITIDNQRIAVDGRLTILEAAKTAHIEIPHLCYLKGINDIGACRICAVELEGKDWLERKLGKKTGEPAEAKTAQSV